MALLGEYLNTYQRANPAQGLLQGLQAGTQFSQAMNQQKMQQQQMDQQKAEREKAGDIQQLNVLLDAYKSVKSTTSRNHYGQAITKIFAKLGLADPETNFTHTPTADSFMTKLRGLKKLGTDNPDLFLKEVGNLLEEAYKEETAGNIDRQERKDLEDSVVGLKKEVAGELGGLVTDVERFKPEYQDPAGKQGIQDYQTTLTGQMKALNPDMGAKQESALQKEKAQGEYKPPQPWGFIDSPQGQKAVGFDPNTRKVVTYDMPYDGQVKPFALGRTPAAEVKSGTALDTLKGNVDRINKSYKSDYVGFVQGRAKQLQAGTVGGVPEDQVSFYADVNDLADMLLRARSGAQINEQEYERLSKLVPTPNLPPGSFKARLKRFELQLDQTLANQQRRLKQGGYIAPPLKGQSETKQKAISEMSDEELLNSL